MVLAQNSMDYIWDRVPKQKDGKTIRYLKTDVDYLYHIGFVDSRRFTLEEWKTAFLPFKQPDETYLFNKDQFLGLAPFRYTIQPEEVAFDPLKIREGAWSHQELKQLYTKTMQVVSLVPETAFWNLVSAYATIPLNDKAFKMQVTEPFKKALSALIDLCPSPRHRLEKEVLKIRAETDKKALEASKNRDQSRFAVGQTGIEIKQASFKNLQSSAPQSTENHQIPQKELDIKTLKKPAGKFLG